MCLIIVSDVNAEKSGSNSYICDKSSGKCDCKDNVVGDKCTQCSTEHWGFPTCQSELHFYPLISKKKI